jgi:hypothetical protein
MNDHEYLAFVCYGLIGIGMCVWFGDQEKGNDDE